VLKSFCGKILATKSPKHEITQNGTIKKDTNYKQPLIQNSKIANTITKFTYSKNHISDAYI